MLLLFMIFFHIVDDYYLQGILAKMKQREWWQRNAPGGLYEHDYVMALIMHGFSWAFMIMLPIAYKVEFAISLLFCIMFVANMVVHIIVDHLKANCGKLNLIQDQLIHLGQILITFAVSSFFLIG